MVMKILTVHILLVDTAYTGELTDSLNDYFREETITDIVEDWAYADGGDYDTEEKPYTEGDFTTVIQNYKILPFDA
jgi:hypothetical protein